MSFTQMPLGNYIDVYRSDWDSMLVVTQRLWLESWRAD